MSKRGRKPGSIRKEPSTTLRVPVRLKKEIKQYIEENAAMKTSEKLEILKAGAKEAMASKELILMFDKLISEAKERDLQC